MTPDKSEIIRTARELGFDDIGFTTIEPFTTQRELLLKKEEEYSWTKYAGLDLVAGTDPRTAFPEAKSIIVLLQGYFHQSFPAAIEGNFGRCYLDDDRVTKDGMAPRLKAFRHYLRGHGIESKAPFHIPHRLAAARAGVGTFGKNCLLYANRAMRGSSFVIPLALLVTAKFPPDEPTIGLDCPSWCRNACVAACPTRALKGDGTINPRQCISFLSYYGKGLTPPEQREPMGMYVYGCDRCQNVCPRNAAWLAQELPPNRRVAEKAGSFELSRLLHMDREYFEKNIWPHMFYMSYNDIWRWRMNVARVMGNSRDPRYVPDLERAYRENEDDRVRSMIVWALERIGGDEATRALEECGKTATGEAAAVPVP